MRIRRNSSAIALVFSVVILSASETDWRIDTQTSHCGYCARTLAASRAPTAPFAFYWKVKSEKRNLIAKIHGTCMFWIWHPRCIVAGTVEHTMMTWTTFPKVQQWGEIFPGSTHFHAPALRAQLNLRESLNAYLNKRIYQHYSRYSALLFLCSGWMFRHYYTASFVIRTILQSWLTLACF